MTFWKKQIEESMEETVEPTATSLVKLPPEIKEPEMAMLRREESSHNGDINAVLGRGSSFEGKLTFEGTVRIEGKFKGEIVTADTLVIGEGAHVEAEVSAGSVIVSGGEVTGNIRAKTQIELEKNARVSGNLETPSLKIEKGVIFVGSCKMENLGKPDSLGEAKVSSLAEKAAEKKSP